MRIKRNCVFVILIFCMSLLFSSCSDKINNTPPEQPTVTPYEPKGNDLGSAETTSITVPQNDSTHNNDDDNEGSMTDVAAAIIDDFIRAIKSEDADSFSEMVSPSGIIVIRNFISGNGARGKDIRNHYAANEIPANLQFSVVDEIPVVPGEIFAACLEYEGEDIQQIFVAGSDIHFLDNVDGDTITVDPSTQDVADICANLLSDYEFNEEEPVIFLLGDSEIVLARPYYEYWDCSWAVFVKQDGEYYLRAIMDFR